MGAPGRAGGQRPVWRRPVRVRPLPEREEATLLRAADGELLGTRKVPRLSGRQMLPTGEKKNVFVHLEDFCLAALGRRLLLWWPESDERVLTLVDPLEGRDVWPERKFSAAARAAVAGEEAVGRAGAHGRFVLVGLPDGRTIADVKLEAEPNLLDITCLPASGQYFLITRTASDRRPAVDSTLARLSADQTDLPRAAVRVGRSRESSSGPSPS